MIFLKYVEVNKMYFLTTLVTIDFTARGHLRPISTAHAR